MRRPQIILTKTDGLNPLQQKFFDAVKSWGVHKFECLYILARTYFTEEQLDDPSYMRMKLLTKAEQILNGNKPGKVTISAPSTAPVSQLSYKEETPVADPNPAAEEPEDVPFDYNDLAKDYHG